jgi:hypothetical protein
MDDGWIGDGVTLAGGQASGIKAEIREEAKQMGAGIPAFANG